MFEDIIDEAVILLLDPRSQRESFNSDFNPDDMLYFQLVSAALPYIHRLLDIRPSVIKEIVNDKYMCAFVADDQESRVALSEY